MGGELAGNGDDLNNPSIISWKEMFHCASTIRLIGNGPKLYHSYSSPHLQYSSSLAESKDQHQSEISSLETEKQDEEVRSTVCESVKPPEKQEDELSGAVNESLKPSDKQEVSSTVNDSSKPEKQDEEVSGTVNESLKPEKQDEEVSGTVNESLKPENHYEEVSGTVNESLKPEKQDEEVSGTVNESLRLEKQDEEVRGTIKELLKPEKETNEMKNSSCGMTGKEGMEVKFYSDMDESLKPEKEADDAGPRLKELVNQPPSISSKTVYPNTNPRDDNFQLAIYIAMAHAGLALVVVVLYGINQLLIDVWEPIQWAVLCSMPLREVQEAIVTFWAEPLKAGFVESVFALPIAIYRALIGTVLDAREEILRFSGRGHTLGRPKPVGFSKLFQWLVSFAFCTVGLDYLGPSNFAIFFFVGILMYRAGTGKEVSQLRTKLSQNHRLDPNGGKVKFLAWAFGPVIRTSKAANKRMSQSLINGLHTIVAVGLIITMIVGSLGGLALFSYKVGIEGKDAVVMIKVHMEENDYAEVVGLNKWMAENKVPELIETYVSKGYEALEVQVDEFAAKNNLTELVEVGKELIRGLISDKRERTNRTAPSDHPLLGKLRELYGKVRAFDFHGVAAEFEATFLIFLEHFQISKEDVLEKAKLMAQKSSDVGKRVLSSGTNLVQSGASVFLFISSAIASGAAELFNFVTQSVVFFSVLYFLITSKTGGVMEHILEMVPLSEPTRRSCANVLDHAVSSVLLATVKTAFFQASFTWLLFRFWDIHFLYFCTLLAFVQAFLPLFPNWVSTIPLVLQLCLEGQYIAAVVLMVIHVWVMDYGVQKIQGEIPGHNAYLTGLSIAGGMALFTPALEGAIMGPLIMTVLISTKNLYAQFVLSSDTIVE